MATDLIAPEDVAPGDAHKIIQFLNGAATADDIDRAIAIGGEPDIGPRLAVRIFARRQALGRFATLQEVADTPLVGPKRFTQIVRALAGLVSRPAAPDAIGALRAEVSALRSALARLAGTRGDGDCLTLRADRDKPYLGQKIAIVATLTDAAGEPRVGAPVTLATTWGRLESSGTPARQRGGSLVVPTDADGVVRVTLVAQTAEDLLDDQQAALEVMLDTLAPDASIPERARGALTEMAQRYRWQAAVRFREAVDIYMRDFHPHLGDTINLFDYFNSWSYVHATVTAFAGGGDAEDPAAEQNSTVHTAAAITLRFKDWLGPWLEMLLTVAENESPLPRGLRDARDTTADVGTLVADIYGRVREYVGGERGRLGEYAARRVAERSLDQFSRDEIGDLALDAQVAIFPTLQVAAGTIGKAGATVLAAVEETRTDLRKEIAKRVPSGSLLSDLLGRVGNLEAVGAKSIDLDTFDRFRSELDARLAQKLDTTVFDDRIGQFDERLGLKVDATTFDERLGQKVDVSTFDERLGLKVDVSSFNTALAAKVDTTALQTALATKVDTATFITRLNQKVDFTTFNLRLNQKVDTAAFNIALNQKVDTTAFNTALSHKVDTAAFNAALTQKADVTTVTTLATNLATTQARLTTLDGTVTRLATDFTNLRGIATRMDTDIVALRQTTTQLSTSLTTVNTSVTRIGQDVVDIRTRLR